MNQVVGLSIPEVLTTFNTSDNTSLPLNLYNLLLYKTFGWSETGIRFPVILAGIVGLLVLPFIVRGIFNDRVALVFAFLLAVAPFPIFYSRFARAYGIVMLLCFLCLFFSARWLSTGERKHAAGFLVAGTLALYTHLLSAVVLLVPFFAVALLRSGAFPRLVPGARTAAQVSSRKILMVALIQVCLALPLLWTVYRGIGGLPWGEGRVSMEGVVTAGTLLSGTVNIPLNLIFFSLCAAGFIHLYRRGDLLGMIFPLTVFAYVAALAVSRPAGLETGAVLLRYAIVVVPVALTAVAFGVDIFARRVEAWGSIPRPVVSGLVAVSPVLFLAAGPLDDIYSSPNNFMNHSAFQGEYRSPARDVSEARHVYPAYSVGRDEIPGFYHWLRDRPEITRVIEYPMDICNYNNLFYFFQGVHGKSVVAGYSTDRSALDYTADVPVNEAGLPATIGMLCADQILSRIPDPDKLKFRNMVDVSGPADLSRGAADVIILHKDLMALRIVGKAKGTIRVRYQWVETLSTRLGEHFGPPMYEDSSIVCFSLEEIQ